MTPYNKWLTKTPRAESVDSIGSCTDGIDNNYDEQIDYKDVGCKSINKSHIYKIKRKQITEKTVIMSFIYSFVRAM